MPSPTLPLTCTGFACTGEELMFLRGKIRKCLFLCTWITLAISIRYIHLHNTTFVMCEWNVNVWQLNTTKEKFKFRWCLTVAFGNLHSNVRRICKSQRSNTHLPPPIHFHTHTAHLTETRRRLIYVNDTECEHEWEFCNHGNLNTKWISNHQHQCSALNIKSAKRHRIIECSSVCVQTNNFKKPKPCRLTHW